MMVETKTTPEMIIRTIRTQVQSIETNLSVLEYLIKPHQELLPPAEPERGWRSLPMTPEQRNYIVHLDGDPTKVRTQGEADLYIKELRRKV